MSTDPIRIYHEREGRIEKSVPRIAVWHLNGIMHFSAAMLAASTKTCIETVFGIHFEPIL